jgi:hypothetical protein
VSNNIVSFTTNFGQRAFAHSAPSGYKALCTANLPDPDIADGRTAFEVITYQGNGGTQTLPNTDSTTSPQDPLKFSPDLVWIKSRNIAYDHELYDTVRGATNRLMSSYTGQEDVRSGVTAFNSDGFSLGSAVGANTNNDPLVAWTWDAGHPDTASTGAVSFDGSGDYLTLSGDTDFVFNAPSGSTNDFTIEGFFYLNSFTASYYVLGGIWSAETDEEWLIQIQNNGNMRFLTTSGTSFYSAGIGTKKWYHFAAVRSGSTITLYVDGTSVGNYTNSNSLGSASKTLYWGTQDGGTWDWNGFISNIRVAKGTALYTSNFTPPSTALTNVTNTKLLCCQSTTSATTAAVAPGTITANGNAAGTTYNPLDAFSVDGTGYSTASAASITQGTIPLTGASVNRSAGFSIVTYTGDGNSGSTLGHGLGVPPAMVIHKRRNTTGRWATLHTSLGSDGYLFLDGTDAAGTASNIFVPSSSTLTLIDATNINGSGSDYVAYCFAPVEGYSAFGSYTGNGSSDGPFVYTGFRPRWVLLKKTSNATDALWVLYDTARDTYNASEKYLLPNSSNSEGSALYIDVLSNGFKLRQASNQAINYSGATYIYAAFAENPFKYARAR